jgi:LPXTG-site transpeptidase (sortase) family protein
MKSYYITLIILLLFGIFLYWFITVVTPVAGVEITYQAKKTMKLAFGTTDIRSLLLPQFKIGVEETSTYPDGSVVIPSLFLDEPVMYNVDPINEAIYLAALKNGIAHASGTQLPGFGGLGYYFAHSSSPSLVRQYNAVFYLLGKLKGGERITLWYQGKYYDYTVTTTKITTPNDVSFLAMKQWNNETIVLQTCWPPGTNEKRLLVFAERLID